MTDEAPQFPADPEYLRFLKRISHALPDREFNALRSWLACFFPYQLEWLLDFGGASTLVKSRRIGGSFTYAAAAALWALVNEDTFIVSKGEREATAVLRQVETHMKILADLGSHWARPSRKKYINDATLRVESGGTVTALPASSAGRGFGGNVILDEFAYHQDPATVWDAAAAATMHGGKIRVLSTPDGPGNLFHELVTNRDTYEDDETGESRVVYRTHAVTLPQARAQGLKVSNHTIRSIDRGNPALHAQLFDCSFASKGDSLFVDVHYYDKLPASYRVSVGCDFAYSLAESADYCVYVVVAESGGRYYVLDCVRAVTKDFTPQLRILQAARPGVRWHWYTGTSERLFGEQLRRVGFPLLMHDIKRGQDKYARALNTAAIWNTGSLLVPQSAPWLAQFIAEISIFTGAKPSTGQHDDIVDALVSAVESLREVTGSAPFPSNAAVPAKIGAQTPNTKSGFQW